MPEEMKLPFETTSLIEYLNTNTSIIAITILAALISLVAFTKMRETIVPIGITIIASCQVVQVIQLLYPR